MSTAVLQSGVEVSLRQHKATRPANDDPETVVRWRWPIWCHEAGASIAIDKDNKIRVPELVRWQRNDDVESFDVHMPGPFANPKFKTALLATIPPSQGGHSPVAIPVGPGVLRITFSHFDLPTMLEFDPDKIPTNDDIVYLGMLSEGSDLLWDTKDSPHGLLTGQTLSGKSATAAAVLAQFHLKGWRIIIVTPKRNDGKFKAFTQYPQHEVITGLREADIERLAETLRMENIEMERRQDEQGEVGSEWWGDTTDCGYEWGSFTDPAVPNELAQPSEHRSRKSLLYLDEASDYLTNPDILEMVKDRVQKGREARQHTLMATQSCRVESFGGQRWGGFILAQLAFKAAIRALEHSMIVQAFPKSESPHLTDILLAPTTPPGRGVVRGAAAPENEFGRSAVSDAPAQMAYLAPEEVAPLLARSEPAALGLVVGGETDPAPIPVEPRHLSVVPEPLPDTIPTDLDPEPAAAPNRLPLLYAATGLVAAVGSAVIIGGAL